MFCCPRRRHMDSSVCRTINQVSNLFGEIRKKMLPMHPSKFIGFVGNWGVGKDSLALKVLDMDIPDPKLEVDHPNFRRKNTRDIRNLIRDEHFDLIIRIVPGKYSNRELEKNFFDLIAGNKYYFDFLVFCFALNCSTSFYSLETKWIPQAKAALNDNMPAFLLVGTKLDLREVAIPDEQVNSLKESTYAMDYIKSSVPDDFGIVPIRNNILMAVSYTTVKG